LNSLQFALEPFGSH